MDLELTDHGIEYNMYMVTWYELGHFLEVFDSCHTPHRLNKIPKNKIVNFFEFYEFLRQNRLLEGTELDAFHRGWDRDRA